MVGDADGDGARHVCGRAGRDIRRSKDLRGWRFGISASMNEEDSRTGWHQDASGGELPLLPDRDLVAPESQGVVRFVLWSDVLAEPFGVLVLGRDW